MDLKLGTDDDLVLKNDDLVLVDGVDAIAQDVLCRLRFFAGEWALDTRIGVPYYQEILGQKPQAPAIKGIFREVISGTPGITEVQDLSWDYDGSTRLLSVSFSGQTTAGPIVFDEELII
jgi:hypothetical protein